MNKVAAYRRDNIRKLIERRGGLTKLSQALGYRNPSFISQMTGPEPSRDVTERTARRIEEAMGLPTGSLDQPPVDEPSAGSGPVGLSTATVAEVIKMVGRAYEAEGVPLAPVRFSDIVTLTLADGIARGNKPDEEHVRAVVRLLR